MRVHSATRVAPGPIPAAGRVSVCLPARDEAANIDACLESLRAQDYPDLEILVLDDQSSDDTCERARRVAAADPRVRVLSGRPRPEGWTGKNHALARLASQASGRWLLFTDADTRHAPHALSHALSLCGDQGLDALSAIGVQAAVGLWERAFDPVWPSLLLFFLEPRRLDDPRAPEHFACGQYLLVERSAYEAVGGQRGVRQDIVEDCALMGRLKRSGRRVRVYLRSDLYSVRMYSSLATIWEGWSKNSYPALVKLGRGPGSIAAAVAVLLALTVLPFLMGVGPALAALAVSAVLRRLARRGVLSCWTLPLGGLLASAILINSTLRTLTGARVSWKGRSYVPRDGLRSALDPAVADAPRTENAPERLQTPRAPADARERGSEAW